jgi:hypothetical protein
LGSSQSHSVHYITLLLLKRMQTLELDPSLGLNSSCHPYHYVAMDNVVSFFGFSVLLCKMGIIWPIFQASIAISADCVNAKSNFLNV